MGSRIGKRYRLLVAVVAVVAALASAAASKANTLGPGYGPSPHNAITYQPAKHTCNSRLPMNICENFTVDIETSLNGGIVSLFYSQSYFCDLSVTSGASTGCEFGQQANKLPPGVAGPQFTDPLYLMFPSGALAKQPNSSLKPECQHTGLCTDHPSRVDFSRILGSGAQNMLLPRHDHFVTTRNGNRPEWHNLYAFMVSKKSSWERADGSHNVQTLFQLAKTPGSGVSGPYPSNIFFFFQTLPGSPVKQEVAWSMRPTPRVNKRNQYDPSITGRGTPLLDHLFTVKRGLMQFFFAPNQIRTDRVTRH